MLPIVRVRIPAASLGVRGTHFGITGGGIFPLWAVSTSNVDAAHFFRIVRNSKIQPATADSRFYNIVCDSRAAGLLLPSGRGRRRSCSCSFEVGRRVFTHRTSKARCLPLGSRSVLMSSFFLEGMTLKFELRKHGKKKLSNRNITCSIQHSSKARH